jgi:hypothetical protein
VRQVEIIIYHANHSADLMKDDDWSRHGGGNFPANLPPEAGATHAGMFLFDHEAIDMAQSADAVTVQVRGPSGVISQHSGVYLIGVDGGCSTVRRRSGITFEGFTWPERFIVLTTPLDFEAECGYC